MKIRTERLKEMIREATAELLLHGIADPRLGFCTVTKVDLTNDLAYCKIHVSVLGDDSAKSRTMAALRDARGLIQVHIAKRMKTRTTPHVTVELDESIDRQFAIIEKIKAARASDSDGGAAPAPAPTSAREHDEDDEDDSGEEADEAGEGAAR